MSLRLYWWTIALGVVVMLGWLSAFIRWLNGLESGEQALVLAAIGVGGSCLWFLTKLAMRAATSAIASRWKERQVSRDAERKRLEPQRRMTLMEARQTQPEALAAFNEALARMGAAAHEFRANADAQVARMNAAPRPVSDKQSVQLLKGTANVVDRYSDEMHAEVTKLKRAVKQLGDAWSSRMYWHDQRGSASDILDSEIPRTTRTTLGQARDAKVAFITTADGLINLEGWEPKLDKAIQRHRRVLETLIKSIEDFETVCETVLAFHRSRSGWRGLIRTMTRWFRRKR